MNRDINAFEFLLSEAIQLSSIELSSNGSTSSGACRLTAHAPLTQGYRNLPVAVESNIPLTVLSAARSGSSGHHGTAR